MKNMIKRKFLIIVVLSLLSVLYSCEGLADLFGAEEDSSSSSSSSDDTDYAKTFSFYNGTLYSYELKFDSTRQVTSFSSNVSRSSSNGTGGFTGVDILYAIADDGNMFATSKEISLPGTYVETNGFNSNNAYKVVLYNFALYADKATSGWPARNDYGFYCYYRLEDATSGSVLQRGVYIISPWDLGGITSYGGTIPATFDGQRGSPLTWFMSN